MRLVAALLFCGSALFAQSNDWLIVPGKRLGPITSETNRNDLDRVFDKRNVVDRDVDTGEGPYPATVIFPNSPAELAVVWNNLRIDAIWVCFGRQTEPCNWHTKDGITLGTSFDRLESLNGRAFSVLGWGTDQGCVITSWYGGRLAREFGNSSKYVLLTLDFEHPLAGLAVRQNRDLDELEGLRRPPRSSDPAFRRLKPKVARIAFSFPNR
jgi:hypothetical protein